MAEVAAAPTTIAVERLATTLSAQFEAATARVGAEVEKLAARVDDNEQQRQSNRNDDAGRSYQTGDRSGSVMCFHRSSSSTPPTGGSSATQTQ